MRQGIQALWARDEPDQAALLQRWLTEGQQKAFTRLPAHDRAHLIRVGRELAKQAPGNTDLVVAGLLHDIGKQGESRSVTLVDRTLKVLLSRFAPGLLVSLTKSKPAFVFEGLYLAVHHPQLGGDIARSLGCTERTVWLITHHEETQIQDPDLQLLMAVDRATP